MTMSMNDSDDHDPTRDLYIVDYIREAS